MRGVIRKALNLRKRRPEPPAPSIPPDIARMVQETAEIASQEILGKWGNTIRELAAVCSAIGLVGLDLDEPQLSATKRLAGTTILEAFHIINALHSTENVTGDACEFGVAHGTMSALMSLTLNKMNDHRQLWLYDSFEGLPQPTAKDVLIHDINQLGSMDKYKGQLAVRLERATSIIEQAGAGGTRIKICKGWVEEMIATSNLPDHVSFAYLDMDLYEPTKITLDMLQRRMPSGGRAVVDDYGFFSSGVETAVTEFLGEHPHDWAIERPFHSKFVVLARL